MFAGFYIKPTEVFTPKNYTPMLHWLWKSQYTSLNFMVNSQHVAQSKSKHILSSMTFVVFSKLTARVSMDILSHIHAKGEVWVTSFLTALQKVVTLTTSTDQSVQCLEVTGDWEAIKEAYSLLRSVVAIGIDDKCSPTKVAAVKKKPSKNKQQKPEKVSQAVLKTKAAHTDILQGGSSLSLSQPGSCEGTQQNDVEKRQGKDRVPEKRSAEVALDLNSRVTSQDLTQSADVTKTTEPQTTAESFTCEVCGFCTRKRQLLKDHMKRSHRTKTHTCSQCTKSYGLKKDLNRHIKLVHSFNSRQFACPKCSYTAKVKQSLQEHMKRNHVERDFVCHMCGKSFGVERDFQRHLRSHKGLEVKLECAVCQKSYSTSWFLKVHMKTHKEGYVKESFSCEECGRTFAAQHTLLSHIDVVHLGKQQTFLCTKCGQRFLQKRSLINHQLGHAGIKPYVCSVCDKCFRQKSSLHEHETIHSNLKPFKCEVCGNKFRSAKLLRNHSVVHSTEKNYQCLVCQKKFKQKNALTRHLRIHSESKPYICDQCDAAFNDDSILRRHKIGVHKIQMGTKSSAKSAGTSPVKVASSHRQRKQSKSMRQLLQDREEHRASGIILSGPSEEYDSQSMPSIEPIQEGTVDQSVLKQPGPLEPQLQESPHFPSPSIINPIIPLLSETLHPSDAIMTIHNISVHHSSSTASISDLGLRLTGLQPAPATVLNTQPLMINLHPPTPSCPCPVYTPQLDTDSAGSAVMDIVPPDLGNAADESIPVASLASSLSAGDDMDIDVPGGLPSLAPDEVGDPGIVVTPVPALVGIEDPLVTSDMVMESDNLIKE